MQATAMEKRVRRNGIDVILEMNVSAVHVEDMAVQQGIGWYKIDASRHGFLKKGVKETYLACQILAESVRRFVESLTAKWAEW